MPINIKEERRLLEAARRDRNENRYFRDLREGFDKQHVKPEDFSIRELFEEFVDDGREIVDSWNPKHGDGQGVRLMEAGNAVDTAAFSNIMGQIVYNAIMQPLQAEEYVFSRLIPNQPTDLNGEKIAGISQLGDSGQVVNEGQPYPTVGVGEDYIETPQTTKRGIIVPVTKEAMFFDRTSIMLERCSKVGDAIAIGKEKRAIDCIVDENTTAHRYKWRGTSYASYQASTPWANIQTSNALVDWTDLDALEQLLNAIVDPWTGEPVMVDPTHLIVTKQLEQTAMRIINATEIRVATPGYAVSANPTETQLANPYRSKYTVVSSRQLAARMATDTSWFLMNPAKYAKYMENWPTTVVQAPVNSELEFTSDIVFRWKASERGAYSVIEPRAAGKSTVA